MCEERRALKGMKKEGLVLQREKGGRERGLGREGKASDRREGEGTIGNDPFPPGNQARQSVKAKERQHRRVFGITDV